MNAKELSLKLVSTIFYQIFIFHQRKALWKPWKVLFISSKSSFYSWDIQIFVFSSSPLFSAVSHCLRGWSKKNPKFYDVISCLSKNLLTHFVWYLEKELRCDTETLSNNRELRNIFTAKPCRKSAPKASPRPLFNFAKNPKQPLHATNSFKTKVFWERIIKKH